MKLASLATLCLLLPGLAFAQLSFDRSDVEAEMTAAQVMSYDADNAVGQTFDLNGPVYDFSIFTAQSTSFQRQYLDPTVTTFPHEYPTATHAQIISMNQGEGFMYLRLDNTGLYFLGYATVIQGADFILKYSPERPSMRFPFRKGTSWNYVSDSMVPFEGMSQVEESRVEVIADGTIRTPQGEAPCIVVRNWERSTTKIEFGGQVISESYQTVISYNFMTKSGISATIVIDSLDENSSTPKLVEASWAVVGGQTSVEEPPVASGLRIHAAYPNPVRSGDLSVNWSTEEAGVTQLSVTDLYGRVLRELHSGFMPAGKHAVHLQLGDLPSGQYFLRVTRGMSVAIRPLSVVH